MEKGILDKLPALRDLWLLRAAKEGQEITVEQLLDRDAIIDSKDKESRTPLSWAAAGGHEAVVKLLLGTEGVNPDAKDRYGRTPLWSAAYNGHEAVVKLLQRKTNLSWYYY